MSGIPKLNEEIMKACQLYVDNLIKPIHSLGKLEEMAVRIAGIRGGSKAVLPEQGPRYFWRRYGGGR